jgi:hypothetical protein
LKASDLPESNLPKILLLLTFLPVSLRTVFETRLN